MFKTSKIFIYIGITMLMNTIPAMANFDKLNSSQNNNIITIHSTTDTWVFQPIIEKFKSTYPYITVNYVEYSNTIDLYNTVHRHLSRDTNKADIIINSGTHLQFDLVQNYGAIPFTIDGSRHTATNSLIQIWDNRLLAFSYEKGVIVYNKNYINNIPNTHYDFQRFIVNNDSKINLKNRIIRYDINRSAVGFLLEIQNYVSYKNTPKLWRLLACTSDKLAASTLSMLKKVNTGDVYIAYNVLSSYASKFIKDKPHLALAQLNDYPVGILRTAFIPQTAPNPESAKKFMQFIATEENTKFIHNALQIMPIDRKIPNILTLSPGMLLFNDTYYKNNILTQWRNKDCP